MFKTCRSHIYSIHFFMKMPKIKTLFITSHKLSFVLENCNENNNSTTKTRKNACLYAVV